MLQHRGRCAPLLILALPLAACASAGGAAKAPGGADLGPARAALEEARRAGAPERTAETFRLAEAHLKEAEARCAASLAVLYPKGAAVDKATRSDDPDLAGRLRRAEDERHRLEERVALLQRELELTETEVVRTKARLQGIETKADASSAIAEARILMGRVDARDRATLGRCQELLSKAEQQIQENNFGPAVFFARKVQEVVTKA